MPDEPLRQLAEEHAELIAVMDRAAALRRALTLLARESQVAWSARPTAAGALILEEVVGNKTDLLQSLLVPPGTGLTGRVFQTCQVERVDDYFASRLITHAFDSHIAAEEVRRLLAVPLVWQGKILGVLAVGRRDDGNFGGQDVDRASTVAAQAALAVSVAERARLSKEIAVHEERRRVAANLHDTVGAMLFAIGSGVADLAAAAQTDPELYARLDQIQRHAHDATTALRESLRMLRSSPAALSLGVALQADCTAFSDRAGLPAELILLNEDLPELAPSRSHALLAAVREALLNVEKHSKATAVIVSVQRRGAVLTVAVHDDGVGLAADHQPGLGLTTTTESLSRLGGSLTVVSDPDGGTIWRAQLPC